MYLLGNCWICGFLFWLIHGGKFRWVPRGFKHHLFIEVEPKVYWHFAGEVPLLPWPLTSVVYLGRFKKVDRRRPQYWPKEISE